MKQDDDNHAPAQWRNECDRLRAINAELVEALGEAEEYFDQRADAEYLPHTAAPQGNEEMRLLMVVRAALDKARK